MAIKLAANLGFLFKEKPFLERFQAASSVGFKGVEIGADVPASWTIQQLVKAKEEAKVEVVGLCTPNGNLPGDRGLAAQPGREEEFKASLSTAIEYAVALKCPRFYCIHPLKRTSCIGGLGMRVHPLAGTVDGSDTSALARAEKTYVANLKYAADKCAECGLTVLIEPIATIPQYFLLHQQQAVDILKQVDKANVKIEFDTFHAQSVDGNLTLFLKNNLKSIGHIQISQVPGRHEPDDNGEINFPFFFKTLVSLGYDGWIGCEYQPAGTTEEGLGWAKPYFAQTT